MAAGALANANSFAGVLLFDDRLMLRAAGAAEDPPAALDPLLAFGGKDSPAAGRPMTALTFLASLAIEAPPEAAEAAAPVSYRAVNLGAHLLAVLALFGVIRRTLARLLLGSAEATALALAAALPWVVHPVHTAAVTYVSQRAEVLMGMFFLAALYAFARGEESARPGRWHALCVGACALSLASKEVGAVLPIVLLLYDRAFASGSLRGALVRHRRLYVGLACTWGISVALLLSDPRPGTVAWRASGLDPLNYGLTQARAIGSYLEMVLWPWPLYFDHGWPVAPVTSLADLTSELRRYGWDVVACAVALIATIGMTIRQPVLGFLPAVWFLTLAPSSSVIPIASEIVALHRVYLASAALLLGCVVGLRHLLLRAAQRLSLAPAGLAAPVALGWALYCTALGAETRAQNALYASEIAMWERNLRFTPANPRVLINLGLALDQAGRDEEGRRRLEQAVEASLAIRVPEAPMLALALDQAAAANRRAKRWNEAIRYSRRWLAIEPDEGRCYLALGAALAGAGRLEEAAQVQRDALARLPDLTAAHWNLVAYLLQLGRFAEAEAEAARLPEVGDDPVAVREALRRVAARLGRLDLQMRYRRSRDER